MFTEIQTNFTSNFVTHVQVNFRTQKVTFIEWGSEYQSFSVFEWSLTVRCQMVYFSYVILSLNNHKIVILLELISLIPWRDPQPEGWHTTPLSWAHSVKCNAQLLRSFLLCKTWRKRKAQMTIAISMEIPNSKPL